MDQWKGHGRKLSLCNLRQYPSIYLERVGPKFLYHRNLLLGRCIKNFQIRSSSDRSTTTFPLPRMRYSCSYCPPELHHISTVTSSVTGKRTSFVIPCVSRGRVICWPVTIAVVIQVWSPLTKVQRQSSRGHLVVPITVKVNLQSHYTLASDSKCEMSMALIFLCMLCVKYRGKRNMHASHSDLPSF